SPRAGATPPEGPGTIPLPTPPIAPAIDMGSLSTPFTSVTADEASGIARALYGVTGDFRRFASEQDDTFRILSPDGASYVMKVANPGEQRDELDLQVRTLRHIAATDPALPVPRVFDTLDGQLLPVIDAGPGAGRIVRMYSFLDGTVLDTTATLPDELPQIGDTLGRLRLALQGFEHPGAERVLAWDIRQLPGLAPLLDDVEDPVHRRLLGAALDRYLALYPRIAALRRQVLHNDFSRSNLVVDRTGPARLSGIIDFGDVVKTAVAIDVSTAMLNWLPRDQATNPRADLMDDGKRILAAYLRVAELTEEELALLPHLVMGRAVTRGLISLWRARTFPENRTYILRNTDQGWAQLDWFLARDPDTLSETFTTFKETTR
ncbi:phosphotransferase, partial [Frigidibacter sp. MR17.14]|uniref:phosphotransferase n=1 Tax=Frigidibacter sp. MR17.14 TaxID=3126509 RepID=UPI0030130CFD